MICYSKAINKCDGKKSSRGDGFLTPRRDSFLILMAFDELAEQYEGFADSLREQGFPMPSFGQFVLLIIGMIILAYFWLAQPFAPTTTDLEVTVLSNQKPVVSAIVQVLDFEGNILKEAFTEESGIYLFKNIPKENIILRAGKRDVGEAEKRFLKTPPKATVNLGKEVNQTTNATLDITLNLVDEISKKAVSSAAVSYTFADEPSKKFKAVSDKNGITVLKLPEEKALNLIIEHPEYKPKFFSLKATAEKTSFEIQLSRRTSNSGDPTTTPTFQYGTLRVRVRDKDNDPLDARLELFDHTTRTQLAIRTASNGIASFPNLLTGSGYYIDAVLEGYKKHEGYASPAEIGKVNDIEIVMEKTDGTVILEDGKIKLITINSEGEKISALVKVLSEERFLLGRNSGGDVGYDLSEFEMLEYFRFIASSEGKLNAESEIFTPESVPPEITLPLIDATEENSALLQVIVKDEGNNPLEGVVLKVYSEEKGLIDLGNTQSDGKREFLLRKNENYMIMAEYGEEKASASVYLTGNKVLQLYLGIAVETIKVSARNAITQESVDATFYAIYNEETFDSCFGQQCELFVKTLFDTELIVTAEGYYEHSALIVPSGDGREYIIDLVPLDLEGPYFKYQGTFDALGREVQELKAGEEYRAKFLIAAAFSEKMGAYFRLGKAASVKKDIAFITSYKSAASASSVLKSSTYEEDASCAGADAKEVKWTNVEFSEGETHEASFVFQLKGNAQMQEELPFYYRGYAVVNGEYLRIPEDEVLEKRENSPLREWCHAKTFSGELPIKKQAKFECNALGCLTISLQQGGLAGGNGFQAKSAEGCVEDAVSPNSCDKADLIAEVQFVPNDPGKEFELELTQANDKLQLTTYSINSLLEDAPGSTGLLVFLANSEKYSINVHSLAYGEGEEELRAIIHGMLGGESVSKSVSFRIYNSCGNGLKDCGNGRCEMICFEDYFEDLINDPDFNGDEDYFEDGVLPPEERCGAGMKYCSDGICRESCEIPVSEELVEEVVIEFKDDQIQTSQLKIPMQIDAFLPADAVRLNFTNHGEDCTPLYDIIAGSTKSCYSIQKNHLVFLGNSLSPTCPLKSIGDGVVGDISAKLKVGCISQPEFTKEIPIEVGVKSIPLKTIQFQPKEFRGSSAKIFHILNQKQVPKEYNFVQWLGGSPASFEFADAYTYAWSGDGFLELQEEDQIVDTLSFTAEESYFPTLDNQGGRTSTCYDYICCSSKWCTTEAAEQAFSAFKKTAEKIASATSFRRGNDFLIEEILRKPFSFATIIRLVENAELPDEIDVEDYPANYGCENNNPKIYAVQASSNGGEWFYKARIARLYNLNYVDSEASCRTSSSTPALESTNTHSFQSPGNYLALCDFLSGREECVESDTESSLASQEQVESPSQLFPIPVPSSFWTAYIARASYCNVPLKPPEPEPHLDLPGVIPYPRTAVLACSSGAAVCTPKRSYVNFFPLGNQLYAVVHVGITESCLPDFVGTTLVSSAFYATYKYPEYARYANSIATVAAGGVVGDFDTCLLLQAASMAFPEESRLQYAGTACSLYSENKGRAQNFVKKHT